MYRTNAQSRAIEEAFLRYGLRYQLVGGTRFYQRREVKDALAYLRVLRNDHDVAAFERIINVPAAASASGPWRRVRELAAARGGDVWAALRAAAAGEGELATRTRDRHRGLRGGSSPGCAPGWACWRCRSCSTWCSRSRATGRCSWTARRTARTAGPTCSSCARWSTATRDLEPEDALDRLLEETALVADQDAYAGGSDAVTLITLHAAKGLEFDVVFIAGLEEGVFPHSPGARRPAPDGGGATARVRGAHACAPPALPDPRGAARHVGTGRLLGARRGS